MRSGPLVVVFLTVFIDLLGFAMVVPLLPIYAVQFATDESGIMLGLLMAIFSVMQFVFAPMWGRLSDRIGRRPVLMIGLFGSVVFYALFGVATEMQSLTLIFVSRIGAGIAGATISTAQAYIADSTTLEQRPKGMALIGMAFGLGFTFGPLFGYLAVPSGQGDPGPWPGYAAAILSAIALCLAWFALPESLHAESAPARRQFNATALKRALTAPSIGLLLASIFTCVFSLSAFETTLSMLIKHSPGTQSPFAFTWQQVCLTYAYIGFTLAIIQGAIVRRIADRVAEGVLAVSGLVVQIVGFGMLMASIQMASVAMLLTALAVVVSGYALISPSLNSLLSRRTDPASQGGILGIGQSVNAVGRITGSFIGIPLLVQGTQLPFLLSGVLLTITLFLVAWAARAGKDFVAGSEPEPRL